mgnify:FL=1
MFNVLFPSTIIFHPFLAHPLNLGAIDIVVVNLYPFYETVTAPSMISFKDVVENIDIGGPAMMRAAAKVLHLNPFICGVVCINLSSKLIIYLCHCNMSQNILI